MQLNRLKWREFITLLGGALAAWSLAARAARAELMRRIGVLMNTAPDDAEGQARLAAFQLGLAQFGWTDGRNMQLEIRWSAAGDADRLRKAVSELVALAPDVILASATSSVAVAQQATRTVPIVFAMVLDPVGGGIVESLARPGGNATGFMLYEYSLSGKWLELLNQITPSVTRAAVLRDHNLHTGHAQFAVIQAMAPSLGVEVIPINVRDAAEIERGITTFARSAKGGLIVTGSGPATFHRNLIVDLAAKYRLPAVYSNRFFVAVGGGLISYGTDYLDQYHRAAGYVDRILKGEKPSDLPVEQPTKFELVINLTTAKALGLTIPESFLLRADEVIE
jgi:putative ABC transport system substrate-binding protein